MAASFGDKCFCHFIVKEAEKLNFIDELIDKKDIDGFTPLYLLCEKGYR